MMAISKAIFCADNVAEAGVERTTRCTTDVLENCRPFSLKSGLYAVHVLVFIRGRSPLMDTKMLHMEKSIGFRSGDHGGHS